MKPLGGQALSPIKTENRLAVTRFREAGKAAYPFVSPSSFGLRKYPSTARPAPLFPLGGISRTLTQLCAVDGHTVNYSSDEHGFENPPGTWAEPVDIVLIGDSYLQGICVPADDQIGSGIRNRIPRTLNLGISGAGPLTELAILREYVAPLKTRRIVWFFYEGNDVEELAAEKISPLGNYLDEGFSQGLAGLQDSIDHVLKVYADSVLSAALPAPGSIWEEIPGVFLLPRLRTTLGFVAANAPGMSSHPEYATLERVLMLARREADRWNGEIIFVYLPDYHRFDTRALVFAGWVHNNKEVHDHAMSAARAAGMRVIDLSPAFAADQNPRRFWPTPISHYGPEGYRLVVRTVLDSLGLLPATRAH